MADEHTTLIFDGPRSQVIRTEHAGAPAVLKVLKVEKPTTSDLKRFRSESELLAKLHHPHIRKSFKYTLHDGHQALLLEYVPGETLHELLLREGALSLPHFYDLALKVLDALEYLQKKHIVHKDLAPDNIIVDGHSLWLIDFGISSEIVTRELIARAPENLEGTLHYLAPEQSGRTNRFVDNRSDYYAVGVLFYRMLTGILPLNADHPMELIHQHLTKVPTDPHAVDSSIPSRLSKLVMKMLAKDAEDRYQSAYGIRYDLEKLRENPDGDLTLGSQDFSARFTLSQRLYGRDREIGRLLEILETLNQGEKSLLMIKGYSGVGKSAVVHEVRQSMISHGAFLKGKFEKFRRGQPYVAWIQALSEFVNQLLSSDSDTIEWWKTRLNEILSPNAQLLIDLEPNLGLVLGPQPSVPKLTGPEAQNRFVYAFQTFFRGLASADHPVVIFLDDLQWSDVASLQILQNVLMDPEITSLLIIGAYRDNEVDTGHPLSITLKEIQDARYPIEEIELANLTQSNIEELIFDSLSMSRADAADFAEVVFRKTGGNAFFVRSFLTVLAQEGQLYFETQERKWVWNKTEIINRSVSENLASFMARQVKLLDPDLQVVLRIAACLGSTFSRERLIIAMAEQEEQIEKSLYEALGINIILRIGEGQFKFAHDQIQQAFYSLIPESEKNKIHYSVGSRLLGKREISSDSFVSEHLFNITNQINVGVEEIRDDETRKRISKLNLLAGQKAMAAAAYDEAFGYLSMGIDLLDEDAWSTLYDHALAIYTTIVEASALCNRIEDLERYVETAERYARNVLDMVPIRQTQIHSYTALSEYRRALDLGLAVLAELGERFPKNPGKLHIIQGLLKTKMLLGKRKISSLPRQNMMTNEIKRAANTIVVGMGTPAMFGQPELLPLLAMRTVHLAIKYGNTRDITRGYAGYGMILCGGVGDIKGGSEFGKAALLCHDTVEDCLYTASSLQIYNTCIRHYTEPVQSTLQPLKDAYLLGLQTGFIEAADFGIANYYFHHYFSGINIDLYLEDFYDACQIVAKHQNAQVLNLCWIYYIAAKNLNTSCDKPWILISEDYDEQIMLPIHEEQEDATALFLFYFHKMILAYLFYEDSQAMMYSDQARKYLEGGISLMGSVLFWGYDSLIRMANERNQADWKKVVKSNQKQLRKYASSSPENYQPLYDLVEAEYAGRKGNLERAKHHYETAINLAKTNNFVQIEGLASELAGEFYSKISHDGLAEFHLRRALNRYEQWGGHHKAATFRERFNKRLPSERSLSTTLTTRSNLTSSKSLTSSSSTSDRLDLSSVLEASQTIAGTLALGDVVTQMMKLIIENAGAQRALFFLNEDGLWTLEGAANDPEESIKVLQSIPLGELKDEIELRYSVSIFDFVRRTKETIVVEDAVEDDRFSQNQYTKNFQPKSVLCYPLLKQGALIGCIYMENNLIAGAFTSDRVRVLDLLSSQMVVSLENARLYENLEAKVRVRTQELWEQKTKTEKAYENVKMLSEIGQEINSYLSIDQVTECVFREVQKLMPVNTFGLGVISPNGQEVQFLAPRLDGNREDRLMIPINQENSLLGYALGQKIDLLYRSREEVGRMKMRAFIDSNEESLMYVPLISKEELTGILILHANEPNAYTGYHMSIVKNLAVYTANAIAHADQYERSEDLLLNILPSSTAEELKANGSAQPLSYDQVSVLFTDFKGFTNIAEKMSPREVVENLDYCFKEFDRITRRNNLEKIKTIGDAYMCAGGVPEANTTHAVDAVRAGLEMIAFIEQWKAEKREHGEEVWEVRVGIHTGKLVAGVVGKDKFAYDIWGDAVNLASRMESSGEAGRLNISGDTYALVSNNFSCEHRGKIKAKGKGEVDMYFVNQEIRNS